MRVRVIWSPLAIERAGEAAEHIARNRPRAAAEWVEGLFDRMEGLADFPEQGRTVPEVGRPEIREVLYGAYRVIYRVDPRRGVALTVRHGLRRFDPGEVEGAEEP